jgi:aminoglycoside phosphotransferase (APT) family kinase protein
MDDARGFQRALREWTADQVGDPSARVSGVRRTSSGFSRENWVFEVSYTRDGKPRTEQLIARRDPVGSVLDTDRKVETAVLRALESTDVPSPPLRWVDIEGARLGRPSIVMNLVPGYCDGFVLSGEAPLEERLALAHHLYDYLADIHLLDWRALGLAEVLEDPGTKAALVAVDHWERELDKVALEPQPELAYVLAWLRSNAPDSPATTVVHGDFKAGNVLLLRGASEAAHPRVTAILDWETVHLGDPREDLGWVTNPLRAREHTIPGSWEPADLIARWEQRTGLVADPQAVQWWRVLANLKLAVIVLSGISALVDGRLDRIHQSPGALVKLMLRLMGD